MLGFYENSMILFLISEKVFKMSFLKAQERPLKNSRSMVFVVEDLEQIELIKSTIFWTGEIRLLAKIIKKRPRKNSRSIHEDIEKNV